MQTARTLNIIELEITNGAFIPFRKLPRKWAKKERKTLTGELREKKNPEMAISSAPREN